jgi:hypothetical protein
MNFLRKIAAYSGIVLLAGFLLAARTEAQPAPAPTAGVMIVQHLVTDYATWRPVFDEHDPVRVTAGLTNPRVYQAADNPNNIVIVMDMADLAMAMAFANSPDLVTTMTRAGVAGLPQIFFLTAAP